MKKLFGILMIAATVAACNSSSSTESKGEKAADTTNIYPTDPAAQNEAATHSQAIPHDQVDSLADTVANKVPGDTAAPR
ncbi:hypothetical protein FC093_16850 [Ilyomonas limi]|uniref:Lipoprotein n=1 Tax=Ilyomonas limi TaxID=2575867 RepID=A0A4V5UV91_9BACT|nr:hypothetical protein [Ilyomonas limi]TKK66703.1 hypothetical protein FC093_16850 [Ilyomonas limi]